MESNRYVLIVAGGSGTRLYPRSRDNVPKQFQNIIGEKTLIEQTFDRVIRTFPNNRIFIASNKKYEKLIKKYLPSIPDDQLIYEPCKKNTASAMALATAYILKINKDAIITSIHADHLILKPEAFSEILDSACKIIEKNTQKIATIGIQPTAPHTGYGYIEREKEHKDIDGNSYYNVLQFVEKPDRKTALGYLRKGTFLWNAGYFTWQGQHFMKELHRLSPKIFELTNKIIENVDKKDYDQKFETLYSQMPDEAVDTAIMEKSDLIVLPADLGWSDVGSWDSVSAVIDTNELDADGNYVEGNAINIDTHNSLILSDSKEKLIATVGLDNMIIVTTPDVTFICEKGRAEEVKKIVEKLKENKLNHLL